jgi:hypothetical protein
MNRQMEIGRGEEIRALVVAILRSVLPSDCFAVFCLLTM